MTFEPRPVGRGCLSIYHIGGSHLLESLHSDLQAGRVCFADGPEARRAYAQLEAFEPEIREGGIVYKCLHDDLGISCAAAPLFRPGRYSAKQPAAVRP